MSVRMDIIVLTDAVSKVHRNDAEAWAMACSKRDDTGWWFQTTGRAVTHEERTHIIGLLHRRMQAPTGFEGFPR